MKITKYNEFEFMEWIKVRWYPIFFKPLFYSAFDNIKEILFNSFWLILFPLRIIIQILHLISELIFRLIINIFKLKNYTQSD